MARVNITCVVRDGSAPSNGTLARVPFEQHVEWPIGDAGEIELAVVNEAGEVYDLSGKTLSVVCRRHVVDAFPVFAVTATNDATPQGGSAPGTATATLASADTSAMLPGYFYWYDVRLDDHGQGQQVVPASKWMPGPVVAQAGEPAAPEGTS
jgi:hypothetical protein